MYEQLVMKPIDKFGVKALAEGRHESPLSVLGPHAVGPGETRVRAIFALHGSGLDRSRSGKASPTDDAHSPGRPV